MLIRTCVVVFAVVAACNGSGNHAGGEDAGGGSDPPADAAADAAIDAAADALVDAPAAPPDAGDAGDAGAPGCARIGYPSVPWPATGPNPGSVMAIDVSGDGVLDLVVGGDAVDIMIGRGDGSFAPRRSYPATSSSVAVADVTGDGVVDLVMPDTAASALRILPGLGDGSFGAALAVPVAAGPGLVAARDFNGDGALDILVSHGGHSLGVLLGGGAMLQPEITSPMTFSPSKLLVADFNRDGALDVAMVGSPRFVTTLMFGNRDGTFQPEVATPGGSPGFNTGDVNGDGAPDLLYTDVFDSAVSVAVNQGDGTFRDGGVFPTVENDGNLHMGATAAAVADVTGDGVGDLLAATADFGGLVILPGNGDGSFQGAVNFAFVPSVADSGEMAIADLNGDGVPDAMIVSHDNREVTVLLGAAGGGFQRSQIYSQLIESSPVLVDLDGDGVLDFIEPGRPRVGLGNGDGTFREVANYGVPGELVATADLDGDGVLDLAVVTSASVQVLRGHGDGAFDSAVAYPAGRGDLVVLAIADLDGDGALDLVAADRAGRVLTGLRGRGDGTFEAARELPVDAPLTASPTALAAVDLDGDHRVDLVLTSAGGDLVTILRGTGDGGFANLGDYATGTNPLAAAVIDVDGDRVPDLVVASPGELAIRVWLGNGNATFSPGNDVLTEAVATSLVAADMNGDGVFDLVTTSGRGNSAGIRLGRGDGTFAPIAQYGADPFATNVIVGDLDGDRRPDMIVTGSFFHGTVVQLATCLP